MSEQHDPSQGRATVLPVLLASLAACFFFLMLLLITGGLIFYLGLFLAFGVGLVALHWIVWGQLLTRWTAGEREEEELRRRAEGLDNPAPGPSQPSPYRFRR